MNNSMILRILLSIVFFNSLVFAQEVENRSRVSISETNHDFGSVSEGTVVSHDFKITNTGTADLVLQDIVTSCGCTVSTPSSTKIAPQQTESISVKFDTSGFSGNKVKSVQVFTNDLDHNTFELKLRGSVIPEVTVAPSKFFVNNVSKSQLETMPAKVISIKANGKKVKIGAIANYSKHVVIDKEVGDTKSREIHVKISKDAPIGELRERIIVRLTGANKSSINIPVFVNVKKDLQINPSSVSFGLIKGKDVIKKSVKIDNLGNKPINIKNIKFSDPAISSSLKTIVKGKNYVLNLSLDPSKVTKELKASVTIETDDSNIGNLVLNVYGVLPPTQKSN